MRAILARAGDFVQLTSCDWFVFDGTVWRRMTVEEQEADSRSVDPFPAEQRVAKLETALWNARKALSSCQYLVECPQSIPADDLNEACIEAAEIAIQALVAIDAALEG